MKVNGYIISGEEIYIWESPVSRRRGKVIRLNDNGNEERCENWNLGAL